MRDPSHKNITVRFPPSLVDLIQRKAAAEYTTPSVIVRQAVAKNLTEDREEA